MNELDRILIKHFRNKFNLVGLLRDFLMNDFENDTVKQEINNFYIAEIERCKTDIRDDDGILDYVIEKLQEVQK